MPETSLVLTGTYHLGDNPGLFQEATFIGYALAIPLIVTLDPSVAADVVLVVETHDLETWDPDNWHGHRVSMTGRGGVCEVGRLKDPDGAQGRVEVSRFTVLRSEVERVLGSAGSVVLTFEVEKQAALPGLVDDFVLTRIEIGGALARIGVT